MTQTLSIPVERITPNPDQPRTGMDDAALHELADSILEHGIIQPLIVYVLNTRDYGLIAGARRLRAAQIAGLSEVPCVVQPAPNHEQGLELALIENLQREDLSPADEARAYARLHDEFNLTDEQIAQRVGKARPTVTTTRNLAALPAAVLDRIGEGAGQLPKRTVRQLIPLAHAIEEKELTTIANRIANLQPEDRETPEDVIFEALNKNAYRLPRHGEGWDLAWPGKPIEITDEQGTFSIPACKGCPFLVTARSGYQGGDFCVNARCFEAKTRLFSDRELARIAKKTSIPIAADGETAHVLDLDYRNEPRARKWIATPPDHLRLVAKINDEHERGDYHHKELLGSPAVVLASTLKDPFASKEAPASSQGDGQPESDADRRKRLAAEEKEYLLRRDERASVRKARADVGWLGVHVAQLIAPQIAATGSTLEFLSAFVGDRKRSRGMWPAINDELTRNFNALKSAKDKDREPLLRERILLHLLHEEVPTYGNDWECDFPRAVKEIELLITSTCGKSNIGLGLKLPAGWATLPIHKTPANCHICGKFAPGETLSQRDIAEFGWHNLRADGVVTCSDECRAKLKPAKKARAAAQKPAAKARATKKGKK